MQRVKSILCVWGLLLANAMPALAQGRGGQRQPARQGHHAGEWLRKYKNLPPDQQQKALQKDPQFQSLPPERQRQLSERLQRFSSLPSDKQQRILNRMETWEHLTPEQKQHARQVFDQLQQLPPDRRRTVENAIGTLRAMPPDARQRAIESGRFSQFSPQERNLLNGASQLPLAPPESGSSYPVPEE